MNQLRFGSALSAIALATMIGGCAAPKAERGASIFGGKVDTSNIGLATKAMIAIEAGKYDSAIRYAERAVTNSPRDAGYRSVLGHAYFGAGRFASAEASYRDSLALIPDQAPVLLKLALVQIAQGKNAAAVGVLTTSQAILDPADYGLALALAGETQLAVEAMDAAARVPGADARLRQNLALAHGLAGDWVSARTIAAQDLSPDVLEARVREWMTFAKPARVSDQVAALTGVTPAASDPGRPAKLALVSGETRVAQAAPIATPVRVAESQPAIAAEPIRVASAAPVRPMPFEAPAPQPDVPAAPVPASEPMSMASAAFASPEAPSAFAAYVAPAAAKPAPKKAVAAARKAAPVRKASLSRGSGKSGSVVQIGAFSSRERVAAAWDIMTARYPGLRDYTPVTARFDTGRGTVWRLSIRGFDSEQEAIARCRLLKSRGGSCFVRDVAGDAPVQIASR